jgi:hypothetical protein
MDEQLVQLSKRKIPYLSQVLLLGEVACSVVVLAILKAQILIIPFSISILV